MADPILSGYKWPDPNLTVGWFPEGELFFGSPSNLMYLYDSKYGRDLWQSQFFHALQCWQDCSGLSFTWTDRLPVAIEFGASASITGLGHAMMPTGGLVGLNGNGVLNINGHQPDLFSVVLHELGAALGLSEGQPEMSVMNGPGPYTGLFPIDIAGAREMYGPPPSPDDRPRLWTGPTPPPSPTVVPIATSYLGNMLEWAPVPGADGYQVDWSADGSIWHRIARTEKTYFSLQGFNRPWFRVRAYNAVGMGPARNIKV